MELDKAIKSRKSTRKFKSQKPNWRNIIECVDAMRFAPTAGNNCTLKIIIVNEKEKIKKIADASQQPFISQVQYVLVVCSDKKRLVNAYEERGEKFNKQQIGSAIENFLLKIEELGLATCWIGWFVEEQIKRILNIPKNIEVEALFPIGYKYGKLHPQKTKIDLDSILYFNEYNNKKIKKPKIVEGY